MPRLQSPTSASRRRSHPCRGRGSCWRWAPSRTAASSWSTLGRASRTGADTSSGPCPGSRHLARPYLSSHQPDSYSDRSADMPALCGSWIRACRDPMAPPNVGGMEGSTREQQTLAGLRGSGHGGRGRSPSFTLGPPLCGVTIWSCPASVEIVEPGGHNTEWERPVWPSTQTQPPRIRSVPSMRAVGTLEASP